MTSSESSTRHAGAVASHPPPISCDQRSPTPRTPPEPAAPAGGFNVTFDVEQLAERIAQRVVELVDLAGITGEYEIALTKQAAEERERVQGLINLTLSRTGAI